MRAGLRKRTRLQPWRSQRIIPVVPAVDPKGDRIGCRPAKATRTNRQKWLSNKDLDCFGRLAQLVRAPCSHRGGHRFESCAAHSRYSQEFARFRNTWRTRRIGLAALAVLLALAARCGNLLLRILLRFGPAGNFNGSYSEMLSRHLGVVLDGHGLRVAEPLTNRLHRKAIEQFGSARGPQVVEQFGPGRKARAIDYSQQASP